MAGRPHSSGYCRIPKVRAEAAESAFAGQMDRHQIFNPYLNCTCHMQKGIWAKILSIF